MSSVPVAESSGLYRQLLWLHGISTKMRELLCISLGQGGNKLPFLLFLQLLNVLTFADVHICNRVHMHSTVGVVSHKHCQYCNRG